MLRSAVQETLWPPGRELTAACLRPRAIFAPFRHREPHSAPDVRCDCGIYATSFEEVRRYLENVPLGWIARVIGEVALWGTVIECERGYRASHAYPTRIYVAADAGMVWDVTWDTLAGALERYGVPVAELDLAPAANTHLAA